MSMQPRRRTILAASAALLSVPALASTTAQTEKKLVVFILRGGLDGLAAVAPVGDPDYARVRGRLVQQGTLALDATFALHPRLPKLHALFRANELLPIHACATAYRERSHFDAQNMLETGAARPFGRDIGWLNAALAASQQTGRGRELGVALSAQAPLLLRGPCPIASWSPSPLPEPNADTLARLTDLYRRRDAPLAEALQAAQEANALAGESAAMGQGRFSRDVESLARVAANFLKQPQGPIAAVIEISGWDTHANQGLEQGPLARNLTALDNGVDALRTELSSHWADTLVVIVSEFGRTAAPNGAGGTDHGTAGVAFLAGARVAGGRVLADWPGLSPNALHEGRDLRPTIDLRSVLKGALGDHLGIAGDTLERDVFPDSAALGRVAALLRS
jgi:uncharacterized protein (DUF1501 family)